MEINNKKVTIIIPIYNGEKLLSENRLKCILNQTYTNLEIIIIDDGSTDNTYNICNEIANNDSRIILIHQDNKGVGDARNNGMNNASGEYIWFCDADDRVELDLVEKNVEIMNKYKVEMIIFSIKMIFTYMKKIRYLIFKNCYLQSNKEIKENYLDRILLNYSNGYAWNKFYRRDFLEKNHLRFDEGVKYIEDEIFNLRIYPKLNSLYISSNVLYNYCLHTDYYIGDNYNEESSELQHLKYNRFKRISEEWNLKDKRFENFKLNLLYNGIVQSTVYNLTAKNCKLNLKERKACFIEILESSYSKKGIKFIENNNNFNIEQQIYYWCIKNKKFYCMYFFRKSFDILYQIKHFYVTYCKSKSNWKVIKEVH